jgi:hypothetical protein
MEVALLLAKLPEAYSLFDPLVDVLPVIPVFFCCWRSFGRLPWALSKPSQCRGYAWCLAESVTTANDSFKGLSVN